MLAKIKTILFTALLLLLAVFTLQNLASVEVTFMFWSLSVPRALLVVVVLLIGALMGWLLAQGKAPTGSPS